MNEIKPIKRSKELAPLSREHHNGLLFVWKIRQGLTNGTTIEMMCNYSRWFWINHIKPHFKDEEKVLIQFLPADNTLVRQMVAEHEQIRELIITLDKDQDEGGLKSLADLLEKHIRFEERKLFAYAEKALTVDQLKSISKQLAAEPYCDTDPMAIGWKEEFWLKKK